MNRFISDSTPIFNKIIVCEEKKKILRFCCNDFKFYKIYVDCPENGSLLETDKRCDYAILCKKMDNIAILIELKGNDIKYAAQQIEMIRNQYCSNFKQVYGVIVYGGTPKAKTDIQNIRKKYTNKAIFTKLFIKENILELSYNSEKNSIEKRN